MNFNNNILMPYYETKLGELYCGDCLEIMQSINDKSIDMILCDLPYGTTRNLWDIIIPYNLLWNQYERIIKDNGSILLFSQSPFDKYLAMSKIKLFRYEWIWEKTQATGALNANRTPMKAHENILVFYKKQPIYNPQKTKGHNRKISKAKSKVGNKNNNYGKFKLTDYDSTERYPRSVLKFKSDKQTNYIHPTQKPVALYEYLIKTYTNEKMIVLDNCAGSLTIAEACEKTNRKWVAIEKEKKYCDFGIKRIKAIQQELF